MLDWKVPVSPLPGARSPPAAASPYRQRARDRNERDSVRPEAIGVQPLPVASGPPEVYRPAALQNLPESIARPLEIQRPPQIQIHQVSQKHRRHFFEQLRKIFARAQARYHKPNVRLDQSMFRMLV